MQQEALIHGLWLHLVLLTVFSIHTSERGIAGGINQIKGKCLSIISLFEQHSLLKYETVAELLSGLKEYRDVVKMAVHFRLYGFVEVLFI